MSSSKFTVTRDIKAMFKPNGTIKVAFKIQSRSMSIKGKSSLNLPAQEIEPRFFEQKRML